MINKKAYGYAGSMITAFLVLFMVIILWNVFTPAVNSVFDAVEPMIDNSTSNGQSALDIMGTMHTTWANFPLIIIVAVIVFMIVRGIVAEQYA